MDERRTLDRSFGVLADHRRRLVIRYFQGANTETASCMDLAEYVSTHSSGKRDPESVAVQLHHDTLPKLEQADLVEYDPRSRTIRYRGSQKLATIVEELAK